MSPSEPARRPATLPTTMGVRIAFALIALAVVLLALAVKIWGPVALTLAALPLVPVIFVIFIWISLP